MKYSMIADYIKNEISLGNILPGGKIPSIRDLCDRFKCTKGTAVRAYYELKDEGIVYAVPGSGYYLIDNYREMKYNTNILDFSGTSLDEASLPYNEFQPCFSQSMNKHKGNLFSYADPKGLDSLIEVIRKHLQDHQVFAGSERIFITTGSQQALDILARMHFPNGKNNAALEQPTYQGMIKCLELNNVTAIGVSRDFKGLDFDNLEKVFRNGNVKFFYTISRFSNPLGLNYTNDEKRKILTLAEKYNVFIIEDDYLGDLESDKKSNPIFSQDKYDRVVYIKTFSKVLLPGLRIAVVVLPRILINTFREYKYWSDLNTSLISQGALETYMLSGMFNIHVSRVRELYLKRMEYLKTLAEKINSPSVRLHVPQKGGFYSGLEILNGSRSSVVIDGLSKKNIVLSDMKNYYLKEFYDDKLLRLSVAKAGFNELETGIPKIVDEIEKGTFSFKYGFNL